MKTILVAVLTILMISCSNKQSAVSKKLSGCDSLVMVFNNHNSDEVVGMVNTTEKRAIRKLIGFLDGKEADTAGCGYDGHMIFYRKGEQLMPVVFNFSEKNCNLFLFDADNKTSATKMSNEEISFMQSLKEGRPWY